jgi:hypothetical protein
MSSSRAIGPVMKLLVAVTMAHSAPVSRWPLTRPRAPSDRRGRICFVMNSACQASSSCATMARQRCELKIQELVDVERPGLVLFVEVRVACLVKLAVEHAFRDEELRPLEVGVSGEQRVVEVEKHQFHCRIRFR